jgi:glycosyltransferase involved in cell wall biosynthesis
VGRLHPIKGIDRLIAAYSNARRRGLDLDLVIVGPDGGARDALLAQARALRLEGNIHFPGAMFGEDKLDAFAACSIFAHRPRFEGFGLTVVEALASARPVVTTRECRLDGGAEAGALLQVEDEDQAFASGLLSIASSRDRGAALGAAGRRWVGATFTWSAIAARLAEDYGRIAGCPAGPSESNG